MSLTLLALFMLPFDLKAVLDPKGTQTAFKDWSKSAGLRLFGSMFLLFFGMIIYLTSSRSFSFEWVNLSTWMAALVALKGILHLFPKAVEWSVNLATEKRIPIFGFIGLLIALGLIFVDTQLIGA